MLEGIISFLVSLIIAFSGAVGPVLNALSAAYSFAVERTDFIEDIDENDITRFNGEIGFVNNHLIVFFEENSSVYSRLKAVAQANAAVVGSLPVADMCVLKINSADFNAICALSEKISALDGVALCSPCPAKNLQTQYLPNDPFDTSAATAQYGDWWIDAIDADSAWGYKALYETVSLGVVDGGFDLQHSDLAGKISFPSSSLARRNRENDHGSHVAGIIAANADNGIGVSGICPDSSLICVDWTPDYNQLWSSDLAVFFGFGEIVKSGARAVNFSLGSSATMASFKNEKFAYLLLDIEAKLYSCYMSALLNKGYDFVVVQSAGNGDLVGNPVDARLNGTFCSVTAENAVTIGGITAQDVLDRIIVVGASDRNNDMAYYSNYGSAVDICAPGNMIYGCVVGDIYDYKSGTSMAAPFVTGICGLLWSVDGSLSGAQVKELICSNTVRFATNERNGFTCPIINAKAAVEAAVAHKYTSHCIDYSIGREGIAVSFTDEGGKSFVFESDENGAVTCLLPDGRYNVAFDGYNENITVGE